MLFCLFLVPYLMISFGANIDFTTVASWNETQVGTWLRSIGMSNETINIFRYEEINGELLFTLTKQEIINNFDISEVVADNLYSKISELLQEVVHVEFNTSSLNITTNRNLTNASSSYFLGENYLNYYNVSYNKYNRTFYYNGTNPYNNTVFYNQSYYNSSDHNGYPENAYYFNENEYGGNAGKGNPNNNSDNSSLVVSTGFDEFNFNSTGSDEFNFNSTGSDELNFNSTGFDEFNITSTGSDEFNFNETFNSTQ